MKKLVKEKLSEKDDFLYLSDDLDVGGVLEEREHLMKLLTVHGV